jgi:hypothetical protein
MGANAIAQLQRATRDYFTELAPQDGGPTRLAFEYVGRPVDPADFRPPPGVPDGPWPRGAEATARLTNVTMRVTAGTGLRTLLSVSGVEDIVLASEAVAGLSAARQAVFERIKSEVERTYEASRVVSLDGPRDYLPVDIDPRCWFDDNAPGWTHYGFKSGADPQDPNPDPDLAEPQWQFQIADPPLQAMLDQPPAVSQPLWQPIVDGALADGPLVDPPVDPVVNPVEVVIDPVDPVDPIHTNDTNPVIINGVATDPVTSELAMFERVNASRPIPTAPVQADRISVDFDYQLVTVTRPWWCAPLLELNDWCVPGMARGHLSDGKDKGNTGTAPTLPVAFLMLRNLRISAHWTEQDLTALTGSMGLGPFSLIGRSVTTTEAEAELIVPGCQLVAWLCVTLPALPPADG